MRRHRLEGDEPADGFFREHLVAFRRTRQLADLRGQERLGTSGKYCGQFCPGGVEAEKRLVRRELMPRWEQAHFMLRQPVEALWAGRGPGLVESAPGCSFKHVCVRSVGTDRCATPFLARPGHAKAWEWEQHL